MYKSHPKIWLRKWHKIFFFKFYFLDTKNYYMKLKTVKFVLILMAACIEVDKGAVNMCTKKAAHL